MQVFHSSLLAKKITYHGLAVAIGNYDGVHRGHRFILKKLVDEARARKLRSVLYTFEPHPVKILAPHAAPALINTLPQKIELLRTTGIDAVLFEKFTREFARHSPEDFFKKFLLGRLNAKLIIVGHDFTFGAERGGHIETLENLSHEHGVIVKITPPQMFKRTLVSSSVIRKYVAAGEVKEVIPLLTCPFFIEGSIIKGHGRGRVIGTPTLNLKADNELMPAQGVYATRAAIGRRTYGAVTNIGTRPTFGGKGLSVETHLLDARPPAKARRMRLYFMARLRDEKKFKDAASLVVQIRKDCEGAGKILSKL